ncbi:hypothetical protein A2U01_0102296, partial [Trifolium medium]|nr:hypothetical protein [Trifolium medium]
MEWKRVELREIDWIQKWVGGVAQHSTAQHTIV